MPDLSQRTRKKKLWRADMENEQKEMWERLTAVEQSTKSAHHRIDTLDKLTESVHVIATETKAMREDVNDITSRVDEIEKRPTKRYETVVGAIITVLVGAVIGYVVKMLGF
jgi:chromosome segregation ATPase